MMGRWELFSAVLNSVAFICGLLSVKLLLLFLPLYWLFLQRNKVSCTLSFNELWLFVGVLLYVLCGIFVSVFRFNSLSFGADILTVLLWAFFVRRDPYLSRSSLTVVATVFNIVASLILLLTLLFYVSHQCRFVELGFVDMTDFKAFYRPLFLFCNDFASVLLCFMPFLLALSCHFERLRWWSLANLALSIIAILLCYSRGAYISALLFYVLMLGGSFLFLREERRTRVVCGLFLSLVPMVFVICCSPVIRRSVATTISFFKTESQRRSFYSRVEKIKVASQDSKDYFFCGFGDGNYFISNLKNKTVYDSVVSVSSNNGYLQLWKERGVWGFLFLSILLFGVLRLVIAQLKCRNLCSLSMCAGLVAMGVREVSFASLTRMSAVYFLCAAMIFLSFYKMKSVYEEV